MRKITDINRSLVAAVTSEPRARRVTGAMDGRSRAAPEAARLRRVEEVAARPRGHGGPIGAYGHGFPRVQAARGRGRGPLHESARQPCVRREVLRGMRRRLGQARTTRTSWPASTTRSRSDGSIRSALYVTGGSYGGFMTKLDRRPHRSFRAAATQRSISNKRLGVRRFDTAGTSGNTRWRGPPWKDPRAHRGSPRLTREGEDAAPHPPRRARSALPDRAGRAVLTALRLHGVETQFVRFPEDNHDLRAAASRATGRAREAHRRLVRRSP